MGFLEVITLVLLLLKAFGFISISWWFVFLPLIISLIGYVGLFVLFMLFGMKVSSVFKDRKKKSNKTN